MGNQLNGGYPQAPPTPSCTSTYEPARCGVDNPDPDEQSHALGWPVSGVKIAQCLMAFAGDTLSVSHPVGAARSVNALSANS